MIGSSEWNKHRPRIVATASIRSTHTPVQTISGDSHRASARAVRVVWLISMTDGRTERLHKLLTASNSCHCIVCTYFIQPRCWCLVQAPQRNKRVVATEKQACSEINSSHSVWSKKYGTLHISSTSHCYVSSIEQTNHIKKIFSQSLKVDWLICHAFPHQY